MLGLVLLVLGAVAVFAWYGLPKGGGAETDLAAVHRQARRWTEERLERLELVARSVAESRPVRELLDASEEAAPLLQADVRTVLASPRRGIGEGLGAVLDTGGRVVLVIDGGRTASEELLTGLETPTESWVGLRRLGDELLAVAVVPVVNGRFEDAGWVVVGLPADILASTTEALPRGGEAVLVRERDDEPMVLESTLESASTERLLAAVETAAEGETESEESSFEMDWAGGHHRASLGSLAERSDVALLLLAPASEAPLSPQRIWWLLGALAAVGALLALGLARWVQGSARRPALALTEWIEAVREEREEPLPTAASLRRQRGFLQPVAVALARWLEDLGGRLQVSERLEQDRVDSSRPVEAREAIPPRDATLAIFELRHHARRRARPVERFARDLERVREAIRARGGRVEGALGHRLLVIFTGDDAHARRRAAMAAVAEALRRLALPDAGAAAEEPAEPPVVAMADGAVTRAVGTVEGVPTTLGLPVQELESLAREGAPGQVVLSQRLGRALEDDLAVAGLSLKPQSGLLSPRPVFVLEHDDLTALARRGGLEGPEGAVTPTPEPGDVLGGRFDIRRRVGLGPLGAVYEAADRQSGRTVALKLLEDGPEPGAAGPDWESLDSPLRGLPSAENRRLARVYEYGRLDEPERRRFLSRRLTPGVPWRHLDGLDGPARWDLTAQLAAALAALHAQDLFHGRLHGANVFVEPGGRLVLTDFGLARGAPPALDPPPPAEDPRGLCLAPEQEDGAPGDARSDVHAWGLLVTDLYDLNGDPEGGAEEDEEPSASEKGGGLPDGLRGIRDRALAPDPADRFADGGELWAALRALRRTGAEPPW